MIWMKSTQFSKKCPTGHPTKFFTKGFYLVLELWAI